MKSQGTSKAGEMDWEREFWDAWNNPKGEGIKRHERVKDFIRTAIQQAIAQERNEWTGKLNEIKKWSANLPIDIEQKGGLYAQGMHAGLDLAIDALSPTTMNKTKPEGKKHRHVWRRTKRWITKDGFLNRLFDRGYIATVNSCECGEWYYITV